MIPSDFAARLMALGFSPMVDFIAQDDGDGPYLKEWLSSTPQPNLETLPEPAAPVPASISDRQFAQQLAVAGLISQDEAIAWVSTGALPAAFAAFILQLPSEQQFAATMLLKGATVFERAHPLVDVFGAAQGMSSAQVDDLWRAAALL